MKWLQESEVGPPLRRDPHGGRTAALTQILHRELNTHTHTHRRQNRAAAATVLKVCCTAGRLGGQGAGGAAWSSMALDLLCSGSAVLHSAVKCRLRTNR